MGGDQRALFGLQVTGVACYGPRPAALEVEPPTDIDLSGQLRKLRVVAGGLAQAQRVVVAGLRRDRLTLPATGGAGVSYAAPHRLVGTRAELALKLSARLGRTRWVCCPGTAT